MHIEHENTLLGVTTREERPPSRGERGVRIRKVRHYGPPALGASDLPSVRGASFPAAVLTSYGDVPMTP